MKISNSSGPISNFVRIMVSITIVGLLASVAVPNLLCDSSASSLHAYLSRLNPIDEAKLQWALESGQALAGLNWAWSIILVSSTLAGVACAVPLRRLFPAKLWKATELKAG